MNVTRNHAPPAWPVSIDAFVAPEGSNSPSFQAANAKMPRRTTETRRRNRSASRERVGWLVPLPTLRRDDASTMTDPNDWAADVTSLVAGLGKNLLGVAPHVVHVVIGADPFEIIA